MCGGCISRPSWNRRAFLRTLSSCGAALALMGSQAPSVAASTDDISDRGKSRSLFADGTRATPWLNFSMPDLRRIILAGCINGVPAQVMLDTGAGSFAISQAFAARLKMPTSDRFQVAGLTHEAHGLHLGGVQVAFANMRLDVPIAAVFDFSDLAAATHQTVDAILGRDLFESAVVDIDFERTRLQIRDPQGQTMAEHATEVPLRHGAFGLRELPISIEGHAPIQALLDLGADRPIYISPAYAKDQNLLAGRRLSTAMSTGIDGAGISQLAVVDRLKVGHAIFRELPMEVPARWAQRVPAVVGIPIFRRFRLVLDFPHDRLGLVPSRLIAQPFRKDRVGIGAVRVGDHLMIVHVASGSPAEAAALRVGDEIVAIDGRRLNAEFFEHYTQQGSRPAGTQVHFELSTGAEIAITLADYF